jgi:hypothetical protein
MLNKYQKGISLYLAISVMTILLAMVLGISAILARQFKIIAGMEDSVVALYAADTGIERALIDIIDRVDPQPASYSAILTNQASYQTNVVCCGAGADCVYIAGGCPAGLSTDINCQAVYYCVKSRGYFGPPSDRTKVQRAIQVAL